MVGREHHADFWQIYFLLRMKPQHLHCEILVHWIILFFIYLQIFDNLVSSRFFIANANTSGRLLNANFNLLNLDKFLSNQGCDHTLVIFLLFLFLLIIFLILAYNFIAVLYWFNFCFIIYILITSSIFSYF